MKVLMITGSYPPIRCGVGDYTERLVSNFSKSEQIEIITSKGAAPTTRVHPLIDSWKLSRISTVLKEIKKLNPDVIHIQHPSVMYGKNIMINVLNIAIKLSFPRTPLFVTLHEYHDASLLGKIRILTTGILADKIISTNEESFFKLKKFFSNRIELIHIGSNVPVSAISRDDFEAIREKYLPGSRKVLVYCGFVDPSKGLEPLIDAVGDMQNCGLIIATEKDTDNPYHVILSQRISGKNINWTGYLSTEALSRILSVADYAVLPFSKPASLRRGSLIAAITHGLPTITTGPVNKPLEDGINVVALDEVTAKGIETSVERLSNDDNLNKLLKVNMKKISNLFDWRNIASQHSRLYTKSIKKN